MTTDPKVELFQSLYRDRPLTHRFLFPHRHTNKSPPFHREMITLWHAGRDDPVAEYRNNILFMAFRGGAKSTIGEEAIVAQAGFREFKNCLVIGNNAERAADRLLAIRRELENNERWHDLFGAHVVSAGETYIELSTQIYIQSMGFGQSMRGTKYLEQRPDLIFIDDLEERENVTTPEARKKVDDWLVADLEPAGDTMSTRIRMAATPLDIEAIPMKLKRRRDWLTKTYPIEYIGEDGERCAQWPDRFPLKRVDEIKDALYTHGQARTFRQEYMVQAEVPEEKPFKREKLRVEPVVRTWQAVYAMFDPARTVKATSAQTGYACWSWINNRLVVWDSWGKKILPDEIVKEVFDVNEEHKCAWVGVEEDGLNEFLMQPIRAEQLKRGVVLPIKAVKAPKGKIDFIKGLQPFFNAREVVFAKPQPDLAEQLMSFPTGYLDVPNALAYALKIRPGAPVYDNFSVTHIADDVPRSPAQPLYLCINAEHGVVTGVLVQAVDGVLRVFWDVVREGAPEAVVGDVVQAALLETGVRPRIVVPPTHFDRYSNIGLVQAIKRLPAEARKGSDLISGRDQIHRLMRSQVRGGPAFVVSAGETRAQWTLNALSGAYARVIKFRGDIADDPEPTVYATLMAGLESFASLLFIGALDTDDERSNLSYALNSQGRRYLSARK